jgi:hypothetical protein
MLMVLVLVITLAVARMPIATTTGGDPGEIALAPRPASEEDVLKSPASDVVTRIRFENRTSQALNLYWLDFEGHRKQYGSIMAGGEASQPTYVGHVWLVTDLAGEGVAIFVADRAPGVATIR